MAISLDTANAVLLADYLPAMRAQLEADAATRAAMAELFPPFTPPSRVTRLRWRLHEVRRRAFGCWLVAVRGAYVDNDW